MSYKTINTIEENIQFGMIDYIKMIIEEQPHIIELNMLKTNLKEYDDEGEYLIYETIFMDEEYNFEIFCKENGYFCEDDFDVLHKYIKKTISEKNNYSDYDDDMIYYEFNWILRICVDIYYYKMGGEFIKIWNDLNNVVRNNTLK